MDPRRRQYNFLWKNCVEVRILNYLVFSVPVFDLPINTTGTEKPAIFNSNFSAEIVTHWASSAA